MLIADIDAAVASFRAQFDRNDHLVAMMIVGLRSFPPTQPAPETRPAPPKPGED